MNGKGAEGVAGAAFPVPRRRQIRQQRQHEQKIQRIITEVRGRKICSQQTKSVDRSSNTYSLDKTLKKQIRGRNASRYQNSVMIRNTAPWAAVQPFSIPYLR